MPKYIEQAKENNRQIDRIYNKLVYNPIWKDFASKGECSFLAKSLKNPITDLEGLNSEIEVLAESGVEDIVKNALLRRWDKLTWTFCLKIILINIDL